MRWFIACLTAIFLCSLSYAYNDHRGHNLDSLERVVGRWTPNAIDGAADDQLFALNRACRDLMLGYSGMNGEKCLFYAYKALDISRKKGWTEASADAYRHIGQQFFGREQLDSALFYYRKAMECVDQMRGDTTSFAHPDGYSEREIEDQLSALYGSIGNVYNLMDSVPLAMEWYEKAGVIFEKYGWRESSSILYYNIGETWAEEGDISKALQAYGKSLQFALGDSLLTANAQKGLGRAYMEQGKYRKALRYLREADRYYSLHVKEELLFSKENHEYMAAVLMAQRKRLLLTVVGTILVLVSLFGLLQLRRRLLRSGKRETGTASLREEAVSVMKRPLPDGAAPQVSEREKEILDLLTKGYTTPQIADALGLSPETVKWYRKKLLVKFDVANTVELISHVNNLGIL